MILRQAAFEKEGTFLKENLHTHTTLSDGLATPEATMNHYRNAGYDFLAITDHKLYYKPEDTDKNGLLIIPAMEADRFVDGVGMPVVHVVALGDKDGNGYTHGQSVLYERGGTQEACQDIIDDVLAANNTPILCHTVWSGNTVEAVKALHGYQMIEVGTAAAHYCGCGRQHLPLGCAFA